MESCSQVAVQASGVLRNLAVSPPHAAAFLHTAALPALCTTLRVMALQPEVVLNSSRTLSKLSLHEGCHAAIEADEQWVPLLVSHWIQIRAHTPLTRHLAACMYDEAARKQLGGTPYSGDCWEGVRMNVTARASGCAQRRTGMGKDTVTTLQQTSLLSCLSHTMGSLTPSNTP